MSEQELHDVVKRLKTIFKSANTVAVKGYDYGIRFEAELDDKHLMALKQMVKEWEL